MKKYHIGVLETHPIQYKVPWFRMLHQHPDIDLTVFYCMIPSQKQQGAGFGVAFKWDLPLLEGYNYSILKNVSKTPGVYSFSGCDTPEIIKIIKNGSTGRESNSSTSDSSNRWDAFIVNGWVVKSCLQTLYACRRYKVPCVVRGEANGLRPRVWWKILGHRALLAQYSAFISIGNENRKYYMERGVQSKKIFSGFYCVDSKHFACSPYDALKNRYDLRKKWDIPSDVFCIVFSGKLESKKRPLDLLNALLGVTQPIHLLIVGDGELRIECEKFVNANHLPVTFTGFLNQTDLPNAYAVCDCMVLPSDYGETWGLVVNEAMACGLPVVVSDQVGCHTDLIIEGETGFTYPCGDVNALTSVLNQLSIDIDYVKDLGNNAREHIKQYSIENLTKGSIDAIKFVCDK